MDKIIRPVFTLELNYKIVPGLVTIGKYDGTHPCLTAATTADKVLIHSPHRRSSSVSGRVVWSESNREIATLSVNQALSALVAGKFLPNEDKDVLIIGTPTHVLAYHVHDNRDVFYKECTDGVKAMAIGHFGDSKSAIVFIGGNSSVHGLNHEGEEVFWTAVGDVVTSIALVDFYKSGVNELIVSSEDYTIRVYKGDKVTSENVETEVVTGLASLPESRFAYSVSNGTVGVYEQEVRLWRVKSKNFAISMRHYDLLGQGTAQLITGWSNGKIDCRSIKTGEVLFKDSLKHSIAGIVDADYRSIGKTDVICLTVEGEVRGYTTTKCLTETGSVSEQETVRELLSQKQQLILELKQYENNTKYNEESSKGNEDMGVIPASTRLQIGIATNEESSKPHVEIFISTNNDTIIRAVVIFAEGIFKGETNIVHPPRTKLGSNLSVPLILPKDIPIDIHIKAFVGYTNSLQYHVFELTRQLPRFSMYALKEGKEKNTDSYVEFKINERLQRICIWVNQNFLLPTDIEYECGSYLEIYLKSLRDSTDLILHFDGSGKTVFYTPNLLLAADLIQSLACFCKFELLQSKACFPEEEKKLITLMEVLSEIQDSRLRLGTDIADKLGQIRNLVVRAEDSRINALDEMCKYYDELNIINKELINGYNIRLSNYTEGRESMKSINSIIQKASRLRVGPNAANMIGHCRTAIKNNNIEMLIKVIQNGEP
ncbi:hypothetical protein PPYR_01724 [Photinus pyralis]|uniref:Bardet-Biedl syndrome 2 protein homolog n=3 Tax=Photinus pyralis TaxID=7054 RepID=A0A5N4B5D2_PHOPY|nr:Bardet-Biedl syndrome 2 protein homolog [Photinus pyralis]KAB0804754.1 hypothetical protein PPYR_01724 [Photinus pyralis]